MKAKVLVGFNFGYAHGFEGQEIELDQDKFEDLKKKGFVAEVDAKVEQQQHQPNQDVESFNRAKSKAQAKKNEM